MPVKTLFASAGAAAFRVFLMPIDTFKTSLQVDGGAEKIMSRLKDGGPVILYQGALASAAATFVGHYPWFLTYNTLSRLLPPPDQTDLISSLVYNAFLGLCASLVSDTCSNSLRVIKTTKQTSSDSLGYVEITKNIIEEGGLNGLFFRGLQTRLLANALQGMLFSVLWKYFQTTMTST